MKLAMVILAAMGAGSGAYASSDEVERTLDDGRFRFCHEAGVDAGLAREYCALLEGRPGLAEDCPGLAETCAGAEAEPSGCAAGLTPPPEPEEDEADPLAQRPLFEGCEPSESDGLAGTVGRLLKWVTALCVAALVLVFLRVVARSFGQPAAPARPSTAMPVAQEPSALDDVPDLPADDLLGAARQALEQGRDGEAVSLARGAVLRGLADAGRLRLHRSRTDREYARAVREDPVHDDLREVLGAMESHRWHGRVPAHDLASRAVDAASRVLAVLVPMALLLLVAWPAAASRYDPLGDAALYDVLEAWGHDVRWRSRPLSALDDDTDVVFIDRARVDLDDETWAKLRAWVEAGGVVVHVGDTEAVVSELGERVPLSTSRATVLDPRLAGHIRPPRWPGGAAFVWESLDGAWVWTEAGADTEGGARPVVRSIDLGAGHVIGIADGRLIRNGAFVDPDNEAFVGDLLHTAQGSLGWALPTPIRVDVAVSSSGSSGGGGEVQVNPRMIPFVVQLLLLWAVAGVWLGWPFGTVREASGGARTRFSAHVAALGRRLMATGDVAHAHHLLARYWLHRLGNTGLRAAVLRAGVPRADADEVVRRCVAAAGDPASGNADDLAILERIAATWHGR